jgi:hypothetical protein
VVRPSGGANCSSVGSVIDLLFVAGTLGGALLVAVTAALDERSSPPANEPEKQEDKEGVDAAFPPPPSAREGEGGWGG